MFVGQPGEPSSQSIDMQIATATREEKAVAWPSKYSSAGSEIQPIFMSGCFFLLFQIQRVQMAGAKQQDCFDSPLRGFPTSILSALDAICSLHLKKDHSSVAKS